LVFVIFVLVYVISVCFGISLYTVPIP